MPRCPKCEKLMDASETRCPFCGESVQWEKKEKIASKELEESGPVGRGGFLILFLVYLVATLFFTGYFFLGYLSVEQRFISGLFGLYILYDIVLIVMYFTRSRLFRTTALFLQALHLACAAANVVYSIGADPSGTSDYIMIGVFQALLIAGATVYLLRSRRVRNTYRTTGRDS